MQVIETPVVSITTETIDDVPLLVAQLQKMGFPLKAGRIAISMGYV